MWGSISSISKFKSGRYRRSGLAPPIIATIAAASIAGAIATSARASTPEDAAKSWLFAATPSAHSHPLSLALKSDLIAIEPMAATLRAKLDMAGSEQILRRMTLKPRASRMSGTGSMYNPTKAGDRSGGAETASGETYEADAWAAAIQIDLRAAFGGVRYGRNYQPAFALVISGGKSAVVKINDVGPLLPGRVIDLTERTMRYFDATLERGLLPDVEVVPLPGEDWRAGPLNGGPALPMAGDLLADAIH